MHVINNAKYKVFVEDEKEKNKNNNNINAKLN